MTGQTLQALGREGVFQSAAAIFFISGGRGEIIENNKKKKKKRLTKAGKISNEHKLACAKRQQMGEGLRK